MPITNTSSKVAALGLALLIAPAASLSAYATTDMAAPAAARDATTPPSVLVFDQKPDNSSVTVKYVYLPRSGYIAIYNTDANGKATGDPLGHVALKAGDHRDVKVQLSKAPAAAAKLQASLYEDKDGDSKLDKSKDLAFWADAKLPAGGMFQIQ
jgi:hypothetical protein